MALSDLKKSYYKRTKTNSTNSPDSELYVPFNAAYSKVAARIRKPLDNYRPTLWTSADLTTGTASPAFDANFHELIPIYAAIAYWNVNDKSMVPGLLAEAAVLETSLDLFYGPRSLSIFTVTIAAPGVFTLPNHGLIAGNIVKLVTTGALPTGLSADTDYFVIAAGLTQDAFELAATRTGSAITTTGSQSGTHFIAITRSGRMKARSQDNR